MHIHMYVCRSGEAFRQQNALSLMLVAMVFALFISFKLHERKLLSARGGGAIVGLPVELARLLSSNSGGMSFSSHPGALGNERPRDRIPSR